ncbi:thioesterase II family protein [Rubrivivax sp. RP6-9]|uniref:thioesterase II family protein n=1 Tax=Rubrivivax sp. RP6-9 TaxID=3415750 RepID=UPI003CC6570A
MPSGLGLWALQYPGREERLGESPCTAMEPLLQDLIQGIGALPSVPFVLLGHSMGAAVAFELCLHLQRHDRAPVALLLSSHPPPDEVQQSRIHQSDDRQLWLEMVRVGGTPAAVLELPDLLRVLTPALRADYQAIESHAFTTGDRIRSEVVVCVGDSDPDVPADRAGGWQRYCEREVQLRVFEGGHFYLSAHRRRLIAEAARCLSPYLDTSAAALDASTP